MSAGLILSHWIDDQVVAYNPAGSMMVPGQFRYLLSTETPEWRGVELYHRIDWWELSGSSLVFDSGLTTRHRHWADAQRHLEQRCAEAGIHLCESAMEWQKATLLT